MGLNNKTCRWEYDRSTESWDTACDNKHQFMVGDPVENGHRFCPYCGLPIESGPWVDMETEDMLPLEGDK